MTPSRQVAGVDCSTQSTKVVVCDAETGAVLREGRAAHPDLTEVDPEVWWQAWQQASDGLLDDVAAIAVGGQQHGMVLTDGAGTPVRDALLWNDNRSAPQASDLLDELGGPEAWAEATGLVPVASFTVTKLRWVAQHEPEAAARAEGVVLPHDWLTHRLRADTSAAPTTDRGDASGTGYWSPFDETYRTDLLRLAFGRELAVPRVAGPREVVGETSTGAVLAPGTGDNMAAALGLDLQPGDVAVSLGTSGTVFAVADRPPTDSSGIVAGFADATGRFLPLVCTLNAARVLGAGATLAGATLDDLDNLALSVDDADGLVLLPFLDGERTPPLPRAKGLVYGLTRANATPAHLARATVEGMLCGLADAVDALREHGTRPRRIVLIGGAARSRAVQQVASTVFGLPVAVPEPGEYVARGAARQAAWTLAGSGQPPRWASSTHTIEPDESRTTAAAALRARYREVLQQASPLLTS
ncbi:MAG: xylulokinase [Propionibacteriales bacterium]|nr:xylulokinase [Propionibacteriales bacterium]